MSEGKALAGFNGASRAEAEEALLACCASRAFAAAVADGRPYRDLAELTDAAEAAVRALAWPDVLEALAAHPRIGEPPAGDGREASWSRQEQAGVPDRLRAALAEANRAYEERFGHVCLVRASGSDGDELLARMRERLGHDEETERATVRRELAGIATLRLARTMGEAR
ncbi:2-oxo-4-hydroxy-4-carboxy-5-ureidoimidazoline decarboxylase [Nonomuraea pusilla]|uniref:2-oxo-4-hydroxy-4-carboxy-5-ureidoimidazoline decarboxylase n=1 Tax=Nonomuraea pusilla TaxID=46177 RepID=A0A1H7NGE8_9ACTN|nr:2-oxo-4-hydroxy-4-carboxy-5-ureidoimidazoline decarboxylase [Nonomuraea pusilla]SEL22075.1 2-oxo-4-hydroxy-4-carboxy-5-ureidoimidazoline decarboxylase [Nonomuraea pusilla]